MRLRRFGVCVLALVVVLFGVEGCAMARTDVSTTTEGQSEDFFSWSEGMELTEDLERVARALGCEESVIERMKSDGVDEDAYWYIAPALAAEQHMEEKYSIGFAATDCYYNLSDSTSGAKACMVKVSPSEGDYAGESYLVRCDWSEDASSPVWTENYLAAARGAEYTSYVEGLLEEVSASNEWEVVVSASLFTGDMYGDDLSAETPIEEVASSVCGELSIYVRDSEDMDEADYDETVSKVIDSAQDTDLYLIVDACCVTNLSEEEALTASIGRSASKNTGSEKMDALLPGNKWKRDAVVNG